MRNTSYIKLTRLIEDYNDFSDDFDEEEEEDEIERLIKQSSESNEEGTTGSSEYAPLYVNLSETPINTITTENGFTRITIGYDYYLVIEPPLAIAQLIDEGGKSMIDLIET